MKIAVTGATGFLGRHVTQRLAREPVDVICIGRNKANWNGIGRFVELDINDAKSGLSERIGNPDALIHLAWGRLPNYRSLHHFETELPIHFRFLSTLAREGLHSMTVAGTCFEYGMQNGELSEDTLVQPDNPYGYAKDALRKQLQFLQREVPFNLSWLRLFYIWGEGQSPKALYSQLRQAVQQGEQEFPMSHGEQIRDFLSVTVAAEIFVKSVLLGENLDIINVCSGQPVSVRRFVESWLAEYGWQIELKTGVYPVPDYEPLAFWGRAAKLEKLLGDVDIAASRLYKR